MGEGDAARLEELRPELDGANAIIARPWNDWELGLSLGRWGILKRGYYLVSQGVSAFGSLVKTSFARNGASRTERATRAAGGSE